MIRAATQAPPRTLVTLQLFISADPVADAFVDAWLANDDAGIGPRPSPDLVIRAASATWYEAGRVEAQAGWARLRDQILQRFANLATPTVELLAVCAPAAATAILTILKASLALEDSLGTLVVRRLFLLPPRTGTQLGPALTALHANHPTFDTGELGVREIAWIPWDPAVGATLTDPARAALRATRFVSFASTLRATADSLLAGCLHPTRHSHHLALVFDRNGWRSFYRIRATLDLTHPDRLPPTPELDRVAAEFASRHQLVLHHYQPRAGSLPPVPIQLPAQPSPDENPCLALRSWEEASVQVTADHDETAPAEAKRLDSIQTEYEALLARQFESDLTSLAGFRRALYLHERILDLVRQQTDHQQVLWQFHQADLIAHLNRLIETVHALEPGLVFATLAPNATLEFAFRKSEQVVNALAQHTWPEALRPTQRALTQLAESIQCLLRDWPLALGTRGALREAITEAARHADTALAQHRQDWLAEVEAIQQRRPQRDFLGLAHRFVEPRRKARDLEGARQRAGAWRADWQGKISALVDLARRWDRLLLRLGCVQTGLQRERDLLIAAGKFLTAFQNRLQEAHLHAEIACRSWREDPWETEAELSLLPKHALETLYRISGPATEAAFVQALASSLGARDREIHRRLLAQYLDQIPEFARACCDRFPVDLGRLLFELFPDLALPALQRLVQRSTPGLIPLVRQHQDERRVWMAWSLPAALHLRLQPLVLSPPCLFEDAYLAATPTRVTLEPASHPDRLELSLSLFGFRLEDYQYWNAYQNPPVPESDTAIDSL